jgi:hypothetical protein
MTLLLNDLPDDCLDLIYYRLHRMYMSDLREELTGGDDNYEPSDWESDVSYSCTDDDSDLE